MPAVTKDVYMSLNSPVGGPPMVLLMVAENLRITSKGYVMESVCDRKGQIISERRIVPGSSFKDDFKHAVATGKVQDIDSFQTLFAVAQLKDTSRNVDYLTARPTASYFSDLMEKFGIGNALFDAYKTGCSIDGSSTNEVIMHFANIASVAYHEVSDMLRLNDVKLAQLPFKVKFSKRTLIRFVMELRNLVNRLFELLKVKDNELEKSREKMRNHKYPVDQLRKGLSGRCTDPFTGRTHILTLNCHLDSSWEPKKYGRSEVCYIDILDVNYSTISKLYTPLMIANSRDLSGKKRKIEGDAHTASGKKQKIEKEDQIGEIKEEEEDAWQIVYR